MKWIDFKTAKQSLRLAWPISLQSILINLLSMIDIAMVSHLGDTAVGAVGFSNRFLFMVMVILLGIAWTVGVLSAQYYGAGKIDKIRSTIGMACILANAALLPLIIANFYFADDIIKLGSNNIDVIEQGKHYLWITIPSLSFVAVILCFENAFRALGQVRTPLALSVIAIITNIILNYWFINGGLGLPALGVVGAALATACARLIQVALIIGLLYHQQHIIKFRKTDLQHLIDKTQVVYFLKLAAPTMLSFSVWSTGSFAYQIIYGRMGTQELAVISLLAPIEGIYLALFFGLSSACSITIGQLLGANRFNEAWVCAKSFCILNPIIALICGLLALLAQDWIFLPFSGMPKETLDVAVPVFILISLSTCLKVINMTLAMGVLRAGGDNKSCTYIDIIGMWTVSLPLTALAAFYFNLPLLLVVLTAYSEEICKAFLFGWRVYQRKWLRNLT